MHADYNIPILKELRDQQVRFAPREKKVEQINRAERLLAELDPRRTYSYEYLCYRITDFRPETTPATTMTAATGMRAMSSAFTPPLPSAAFPAPS